MDHIRPISVSAGHRAIELVRMIIEDGSGVKVARAVAAMSDDDRQDVVKLLPLLVVAGLQTDAVQGVDGVVAELDKWKRTYDANGSEPTTR